MLEARLIALFQNGRSFATALMKMMKKVIVLTVLAIVVGCFLNVKSSRSSLHKEAEVKTFSDIYYKLETSAVSVDEIIIGATEFALTLCADRTYQEVLGHSVQSCNEHFKTIKETCASYLMKSSQRLYKDKAKVTLLADRFINCVS